MFRHKRDKRSFIAVIFTAILDRLSFSIVFPVLAPFFLDSNSGFFSPGASEAYRAIILGVLLAVFGVVQFITAPFIGAASDHYGRRPVLLFTVGNAIAANLLFAYGVWMRSLPILFAARCWTGFCSGNLTVAQAATADLTESEYRRRAYNYLTGLSGIGFVLGFFLGGIFANPKWLTGATPFIIASGIAIANYLVVWLLFKETVEKRDGSWRDRFFESFREMRIAYQIPEIRRVLIAFALFVTGWGFYLFFFPAYLVQHFNVTPNIIGEFFAYIFLLWAFFSAFLNQQIARRCSLRPLVLTALYVGAVGVVGLLLSPTLWPMLLILIPTTWAGATAWADLLSLISQRVPGPQMARILGVATSIWSMVQIIAPLASGPLAGLSEYLPLAVGAGFVLSSGLFLQLCDR